MMNAIAFVLFKHFNKPPQENTLKTVSLNLMETFAEKSTCRACCPTGAYNFAVSENFRC